MIDKFCNFGADIIGEKELQRWEKGDFVWEGLRVHPGYLTQILYHLTGRRAVTGNFDFNDVAAGTCYTNAVA